ncbi:IS1/IS1595 family N-terminal zinc-binding domain-containing protein [Azospirillum doebereinerae]
MNLLKKPVCPRCGYVRVVKSGHVRGHQRWLCRRCGYQFPRTNGPVAGGKRRR